MSAHGNPRPIERHCDVAVIGGSAAGLAAALQLLRQRRAVIVVDAGEPRNAPAAHMHSFLGREGQPPAELLAAGRAEVRSYGGEVLSGRALRVTRTDDDRFRVELAGGHSIVARRVLAATGLVDRLPGIEGLAEHWGDSVIHCPFCHGFEARDGRIVQILTDPMGLHPASLFRQLSADFTIVVHSDVDVDAAELDALRAAGVRVIAGPVRRVVTGDDGRIDSVELANGDRLPADTVVVTPRFEVRAEPFAPLGLATTPHPSGLGEVVATDAQGATSVPGLFAAGNITDPGQQVLPAAANGSWVGGMISFSLAHDDLVAAGRPSANESDWDERYSGDQVWSGNPNGSLVREAEGLAPGSALDVGAGEGGDAVWLAERGWAVTASDVSSRALGRVAAAGRDRNLSIECQRADANGVDPFGGQRFDLVTASYASIPRTPDDRGIHNVLAAVAPGGTLVVIGHDLPAGGGSVAGHDHDTSGGPDHATSGGHDRATSGGHEQANGHRHSAGRGSGGANDVDHAGHDTGHDAGHDSPMRPFDPEASVSVDDFAAALGGLDGWEIVVHERRPRPPGAASALHHVDDVVLRAQRRP